ncbi:MAG TPA: nuclear transport factor 2 family protein [Pyrinomonadaceae bacterium]|nr:nuclear transport factor 2 family protein [Pyrinomonadaceae bacterium]
MKRCPQCQSLYEDAKNFCLNDGSPLVADSAQAQPVTPPAPATQQFQSTPTQSVGWSQAGSWQSQQAPSLSQPPPRKRRVWPWVLGVLGVVVVGVVALLGVLGYVGYKAMKEAERRTTVPGGGSGTTTTRRADLKTYVNSPASFTGTLAEHYSDFSFQYPQSWVLKEPPGQSRSNFVKVERSLDGNTTLENFAVGWYTSTGTARGDAALFPQLANQLSSQFAVGFPGYRKVSEGATRVGNYDGYEFRFTSRLKNPQGKNIDLYGRAVMLPSGSTTQRNGVALIMLATSLAPEIKSVEDVGVRGELPVILESFRMGKDAAANGSISSDSASAPSRASGGTTAAPADRDQVLAQLTELEEEWARANIEGDKQALARILADEYVGTSSEGVTERKAEYIRNISPGGDVESQTFEDMTVVLGGERAVLTGVTVAEFKDGRSERYRFVDTFVWRDGRWQAVTSVTTGVQ